MKAKYACGVLLCETSHQTATGAAKCNVSTPANMVTTPLIFRLDCHEKVWYCVERAALIDSESRRRRPRRRR